MKTALTQGFCEKTINVHICHRRLTPAVAAPHTMPWQQGKFTKSVCERVRVAVVKALVSVWLWTILTLLGYFLFFVWYLPSRSLRSPSPPPKKSMGLGSQGPSTGKGGGREWSQVGAGTKLCRLWGWTAFFLFNVARHFEAMNLRRSAQRVSLPQEASVEKDIVNVKAFQKKMSTHARPEDFCSSSLALIVGLTESFDWQRRFSHVSVPRRTRSRRTPFFRLHQQPLPLLCLSVLSCHWIPYPSFPCLLRCITFCIGNLPISLFVLAAPFRTRLSSHKDVEVAFGCGMSNNSCSNVSFSVFFLLEWWYGLSSCHPDGSSCCHWCHWYANRTRKFLAIRKCHVIDVFKGEGTHARASPSRDAEGVERKGQGVTTAEGRESHLPFESLFTLLSSVCVTCVCGWVWLRVRACLVCMSSNSNGHNRGADEVFGHEQKMGTTGPHEWGERIRKLGRITRTNFEHFQFMILEKVWGYDAVLKYTIGVTKGSRWARWRTKRKKLKL